jgi:hypothetical protein
MIDIIPSNLIEQLIELSDMSAYLQFFAINKIGLYFSIFILILVILFFVAKFIPMYSYLIIASLSATILLIIISLSIVVYNIHSLTLNQQQMILVKSINVPEFQTFVQESIGQKGATIEAIESAFFIYRKSYPNEKIMNEDGRKGLELYNSIKVK